MTTRTHADDVGIWGARLPDRDPDRDPLYQLNAALGTQFEYPDVRARFRATRTAQAAAWRWANRPHTVTADVEGAGEITMSIAAIARSYGAESARLAVRQAERVRRADIETEIGELKGFFQRREQRRLEEREYRSFVRSVNRRRRFWAGLVEVTKKAWRG